MRNKRLIIITLFYFVTIKCYCQSFLNGDLDGIVNGNSCLPTNWLNVPYDDLNCLAFQVGNDSPDLTNLTGPSQSIGVNGNPYSGSTFVSGLYATASPNFFQEGIMQLVSGFIVGNNYSIHFYQTVIRNSNALDKSGSWAIYIDTNLAEITTPTYSSKPFGSSDLNWDARTINFIATSNFHLLKFLPMDDDSNLVFSTTDTTGALRMGIDSIGLEVLTSIDEQTQKEFVLSPNPNNGLFRLQFKNYVDKPLKLAITDLYGKLIDEIIITNALTNYENINLKNGIYFYTLRQGIAEIEKGKIMVIH
jgi:hypothetical protein